MVEKSLSAHFIECLENGNTKKAMYITQLFGDDVNRLYKGKSPLVWAKEFKNEEVIKALEDKGAREEVISIEEATRLGSLLIGAVESNDVEKVVELIENGADVNIKNKEGETTLARATKYGHIEVLKKLLGNGADVNQKDNDGWTALMEASFYGHTEIALKLLENGANANAQNNNGETALMRASKYGHIGVVEKLLERGADVSLKDNKGWTALMGASFYNNVEVVDKLIENGADVNQKDNAGETALMKASKYGHVDVIKRLIENDADYNMKNANDYRAIDIVKNDETRKAILKAIVSKKTKKYELGIKDKMMRVFGGRE